MDYVLRLRPLFVSGVLCLGGITILVMITLSPGDVQPYFGPVDVEVVVPLIALAAMTLLLVWLTAIIESWRKQHGYTVLALLPSAAGAGFLLLTWALWLEEQIGSFGFNSDLFSGFTQQPWFLLAGAGILPVALVISFFALRAKYASPGSTLKLVAHLILFPIGAFYIHRRLQQPEEEKPLAPSDHFIP